jgi:hypothetical protein
MGTMGRAAGRRGPGLGSDLGTVALVPDCPGGLLVIQSVARRLVAHREPSAVGVDGQLDRRVTQLPLDVGWADLGGEEQGGKGVAKTVGREVKGSPARTRLKVFATLLWSNGVPASEQKIQGGTSRQPRRRVSAFRSISRRRSTRASC